VEDDQQADGEARRMRRGGRLEQKTRRMGSRMMRKVMNVDIREVAMTRVMTWIRKRRM
jgi:hypothetical protein